MPLKPKFFALAPRPAGGAAVLVAKTEGDPMLFASAIRSHVRSIDRDVPVTAVRTMDDVVEASLGQRRRRWARKRATYFGWSSDNGWASR